MNSNDLNNRLNEADIRAYLQRTVTVRREHDCRLEIVLKDTHACGHKPERFVRWTRLCREAIRNVRG